MMHGTTNIKLKIVLWRVVKRLSYIEDARCLKVNIFILTTESSNDCSFWIQNQLQSPFCNFM